MIMNATWEELFAPVVDKTSLRLFLTICAMYHKHLVHLDVVSAYLHVNLTGPARYISLWGDEKGTVRQLFKAMNVIDNAAQIWNKHFHSFMMHKGFMRTSRDNCIYVHPTTSVQSCLYVDDILAAADPDKQRELQKFVKRVQAQFLIRVLGEPKILGDGNSIYAGTRYLLCLAASICRQASKEFFDGTRHTIPLIPHNTHGN